MDTAKLQLALARNPVADRSYATAGEKLHVRYNLKSAKGRKVKDLANLLAQAQAELARLKS